MAPKCHIIICETLAVSFENYARNISENQIAFLVYNRKSKNNTKEKNIRKGILEQHPDQTAYLETSCNFKALSHTQTHSHTFARMITSRSNSASHQVVFSDTCSVETDVVVPDWTNSPTVKLGVGLGLLE